MGVSENVENVLIDGDLCRNMEADTAPVGGRFKSMQIPDYPSKTAGFSMIRTGRLHPTRARPQDTS